MSKKYRRLLAAAIGIAATATALAVIPASAADQTGTAPNATTAVAPANSVNSTSIVNGSINQVDLNGGTTSTPTGLYKTLRTPYQNTVGAWAVADNSLGPNELTPALRDKINSAVQPVSVTGVTTLIDRPDSGNHGTWADDNLTRTVAVTRQGRAEAASCQQGATECWFYTATLSDVGSFKTRDGALSPEAGTPINGILTGTVAGGSKIEFYASNGSPNPALVPATVTGSDHPTSEWVTLFFPAGTQFRQTGNLLNWSWTYTASQTCEVWVNKFDDNTGDIKGINAC